MFDHLSDTGRVALILLGVAVVAWLAAMVLVAWRHVRDERDLARGTGRPAFRRVSHPLEDARLTWVEEQEFRAVVAQFVVKANGLRYR